jgi:hypothetical protein
MLTDAEKIDAAKKAIAHLLKRMNASEPLRHEIGFGSQSYVLLTEAAAALFDEPIERIQEHFKG